MLFRSSSILLDKKVNIDTILLCDKSALIVAARITGYGSEYLVDMTCPHCEQKSRATFNLDLFTNDFPDQEKLESAQATLTETGTFIIELPKTQKNVEFKLLSGVEEKKLTQLTENKKKQNLPESYLTDQMKQYIVSIDDNEDKFFINKFIEIGRAHV